MCSVSPKDLEELKEKYRKELEDLQAEVSIIITVQLDEEKRKEKGKEYFAGKVTCVYLTRGVT